MTVRPPSNFSGVSPAQAALDLVGHEIIAEKASALGRSGRQVEEALARLAALEAGSAPRPAAVKAAAEAVYGYFIQRELCGWRRHHDVIREYRIPNEVLVRLGAK